jgi:hypothetical protein
MNKKLIPLAMADPHFSRGLETIVEQERTMP